MLRELFPLLLTVIVVVAARIGCRWAVCLVRALWRRLSARWERVRQRRDVRTWHGAVARRWPRATRIAEARLKASRFSGMPLTLTVLAALYLAMLLGGLVEELMEAEELVRFDEALNALLSAGRTDVSVAVYSWITDLGGTAALAAVAVVTSGLLWVHRHGGMVVPLWITLLGSQATTYAGKFGFDRARPEFVTEVTAATPSFPSGHATGAMAVYGFIAYLMARNLGDAGQRFEVVFWSGSLIMLIGFSRMLLSLHYVSDVAAGFLVGGFWLLVGVVASEHCRSSRY